MTDSLKASKLDCANPLPKVSVVIPAYNAEKFVLDAIGSVLDQAYPVVEILLIDDGSKDGTVELVRREAPQVKIIQQVNAGAAAARNTGLRSAQGDLICFLDADDGWFPGKLIAQADYLRQHPEVGVVYHKWLVWKPDADGNYVKPNCSTSPDEREIDPALSGWIYPQLLLNCIVHTTSVMMRRQVFESIGFFDTTLITGEDYNYWLRVSRRFQIHKLVGVYSYYRETPGSLTRMLPRVNNEYNVVLKAFQDWGLMAPDGNGISMQQLNERLGELAYWFGYAHYHRGSLRTAKDAFRNAMHYDGYRWRALIYWLLASFKMNANFRQK